MTLAFTTIAGPGPDWPGVAAYDRWLSQDGEETARFFRVGSDHVVEFPGIAQFVISPDNHISCIPDPAADEAVIADKFANQVVPLVLGRTGQPVLHGSAVTLGTTAIAFLGATGRGKSTLAASFASAGHPFLTDDGLLIERSADEAYVVRPHLASLRLCADSEAALTSDQVAADAERQSGKQRFAANSAFPFQDRPLRLAAIFVLVAPNNPSDVRITPLSRTEALAALMQHAFILDVDDSRLLGTLFDGLVDITSAVPCFSLDYPRRFDALQSLRDSIINRLDDEGLYS